MLLAFGCGDASVDDHGADEPSSSAFALDATQVLTPGVAVSGLSGSRGQERLFSIAVPAGASNLHFALSGGTGDADLYVRFGSAPTRTAYDYRPYLNGNNEVVDPSPVRTGTYYVLVRGYTVYSGVSLVASFQGGNSGSGGAGGGGASAGGASGAGASGAGGAGAGGAGGAGAGGSPAGGAGGAGAAGAGGSPSTGPDCTVPSSWPSAWVTFEEQTLALINERRAAGATCGTTVMPPVSAIVMESHLRQAARCHSLDMGTLGYFSHDSQDGRSPWTRIAQAGYTNAAWQGENIAAGQTTPSAVVTSWMNSPGHCSNIMSSNFKDTGLGYANVAGSPYRHYWTQDFARH